MNVEDDLANDPNGEPPGHWQLIRDVIAFQFKLAMDGLRDVLLSPVSIIAAIVGILSSRADPGQYFYRLLHFGHRTDRWINLFNSYKDDDPAAHLLNRGRSADHFVRRAEEIVLKEYQKGGAMHHLKSQTDGVISRLQDSAKREIEKRREASGKNAAGEPPSEDQ